MDRIGDIVWYKTYKFFEFFIPFFWLIGGFILIVNGIEIMAEIDSPLKYIVAIGIMLMTFGIIGKHFQEIGLEEAIKSDIKKRRKESAAEGRPFTLSQKREVKNGRNSR